MLVGIIIGAALAVGVETILVSRGLGNNYAEVLRNLFSRK